MWPHRSHNSSPLDHPCHYKTRVSSRSPSLQLTFEDGTDKQFQNVVVIVSHSKLHAVDKPKNQEMSLVTRLKFEDKKIKLMCVTEFSHPPFSEWTGGGGVLVWSRT